jgi:hypothetical protein
MLLLQSVAGTVWMDRHGDEDLLVSLLVLCSKTGILKLKREQKFPPLSGNLIGSMVHE